MSELLREDESGFRNYTRRICPELYQELVERVGPRLLKKDFYEKSTEPALCIAITQINIRS